MEAAHVFTDILKLSDGHGAAEVVMNVGADGHVSHAEVSVSSGHPRLDKAAETDLARCLFIPSATGSVVRMRYIVDVWHGSTAFELLPDSK